MIYLVTLLSKIRRSRFVRTLSSNFSALSELSKIMLTVPESRDSELSFAVYFDGFGQLSLFEVVELHGGHRGRRKFIFQPNEPKFCMKPSILCAKGWLSAENEFRKLMK